jgi:hypothetical protein
MPQSLFRSPEHPQWAGSAEKQRSEGFFEHRISTSASKLARIRLIVRTAERARAVCKDKWLGFGCAL